MRVRAVVEKQRCCCSGIARRWTEPAGRLGRQLTVKRRAASREPGQAASPGRGRSDGMHDSASLSKLSEAKGALPNKGESALKLWDCQHQIPCAAVVQDSLYG